MPRILAVVTLLVLLVAHAGVSSTAAAAPLGSSQWAGSPAPIGSTPAKLVIGAIGVNQALVPVGLDQSRRPIVPRHQVGWYIHSGRPGRGENVVMWGHVLRWRDTPRIPAPFERLDTLKIGAEVKVVQADGKAYRYRVTKTIMAKPSDIQHILPTGKERLTLVSCFGDKVIVNGRITKKYRLITLAEPIR